MRIKRYVIVVSAIAVIIGITVRVLDARFINPLTFVAIIIAGLVTGTVIKKLRKQEAKRS